VSCGNPHETDCREVLDRVFEFLDGEMGQLDVARIKEHLDECGPCLRQYDLDVVLKSLLRRSCVCEQAPQELRQKILVRITQVRLDLGG
jgi:mycothiol system anti-sigma-R factor